MNECQDDDCRDVEQQFHLINSSTSEPLEADNL